MTIPEVQLDTWSKQGSVAQSQATYATIRSCLDQSAAPYGQKDYLIFLQGSYGNATNIYADSDVDVVIRLDSTYYKDLSELTESERLAYDSFHVGATYSYDDFRRDVTAQLRSCYGASVKPGRKAIFVEGNNSRRDADVLPAVQFRRYTRFMSAYDQRYHEGICFWTTDGTQIINYPKQHSANCTTKHQATTMRFKPTVRVFKNMRNAMVDQNYIKDGLAPSYFIEGMLYNVPNIKFGLSYQNTVSEALNWLRSCTRNDLVCANEMYKLLHPTSQVTWREPDFEAFVGAAIRFWNDW